VEVSLFNPSFSSIATTGLKMKASRTEKIRIRKISERRKTITKSKTITEIQIKVLIIRLTFFSVIRFLILA
jgi:hypothetical protein